MYFLFCCCLIICGFWAFNCWITDLYIYFFVLLTEPMCIGSIFAVGKGSESDGPSTWFLSNSPLLNKRQFLWGIPSNYFYYYKITVPIICGQGQRWTLDPQHLCQTKRCWCSSLTGFKSVVFFFFYLFFFSSFSDFILLLCHSFFFY